MASDVKMSDKIPSLQEFYDAAKDASIEDALILTGPQILRAHQLEPSGCYSTTSPLTPTEREINRLTWAVFEKVVKDTLCPFEGGSRIRRFCERYKLDFIRSIENGDPLRAHHVERVGVGAARVFAQDIFAYCRAHTLTVQQISTTLQSFREPFFIGSFPRSVAELGGGPDTCTEMVSYDPFYWDKKRLNLSQDIHTLRNESLEFPNYPYVDRVTKVFPSLEMQEGEIIPAPVTGGGVDFYVVYKKIGTGHGLVAYGLKPLAEDSRLEPWVMLRPTQLSFVSEDAVETWFNDMEENIGETGYRHAHPLLQALMNDPIFRAPHQKILLSGFSLGSAHGQRFLVDFWRDVRIAVLLCGPSLDRTPVLRLKDEINAYAAQEVFLDIYIKRNRILKKPGEPVSAQAVIAPQIEGGDITDYAGELHAGFGITNPHVHVHLEEFYYSASADSVVGGTLGPHSERPFEPTRMNREQIQVVRYQGEDIDRQLDNFQRGEQIAWYERSRRFWGTQVLYNVIYGLYRFATWVLSCFGIQLFRSSKPEEPAPSLSLSDIDLSSR
jgi:hypothetical protein